MTTTVRLVTDSVAPTMLSASARTARGVWGRPVAATCSAVAVSSPEATSGAVRRVMEAGEMPTASMIWGRERRPWRSSSRTMRRWVPVRSAQGFSGRVGGRRVVMGPLCLTSAAAASRPRSFFCQERKAVTWWPTPGRTQGLACAPLYLEAK